MAGIPIKHCIFNASNFSISYINIKVEKKNIPNRLHLPTFVCSQYFYYFIFNGLGKSEIIAWVYSQLFSVIYY